MIDWPFCQLAEQQLSFFGGAEGLSFISFTSHVSFIEQSDDDDDDDDACDNKRVGHLQSRIHEFGYWFGHFVNGVPPFQCTKYYST